MNKLLSLLAILAILNITACASYSAKYSRIGKYGQSDSYTKIVEPKLVEVYVQQYPEGFDHDDGVTSVVSGYEGYEILGEVNVQYEPANMGAVMLVSVVTLGIGGMMMINPGELTQDKAVQIMQAEASKLGGNAIIGATLPKEGQTGSNSFLAGFGYASGLVVRMSQTKNVSVSVADTEESI